MPAPEAILAAGIGEVDLVLQAKTTSALINACTVSVTVAVLAAADARDLQ